LDIFLTTSPWASNSEISEIVYVAATCQDQNGTKKPFFESLVPWVDLKVIVQSTGRFASFRLKACKNLIIKIASIFHFDALLRI